MNITRQNFESKYDDIRAAIQSSHFIAVDCEFTGLRLPGAPKERAIDSVKARYDMARSSCSSFMLTQYGVCCFRYNDEGELEARPFNAFVKPSTKFGNDRVYSCQASSMDFLRYKSWAAHGVPFMSSADEATLKDKIRARWAREAAAAAEKARATGATEGTTPAAEEGPPPVPIRASRDGTTLESLSQEDREVILNARRKVKELVAEAYASDVYVEKAVKLDPMNGRRRWLIYEFVGTNNTDVKMSNLSGPYFARGIEIRTQSKDPQLQAMAEAKLREEQESRQLEDLRRAAGFRRVVDEIAKCSKPVITHNGLLDLFHTYDKFVGPIPADFEEGTRAIHAFLPRVFDSKAAMQKASADGLPFPNTGLGAAYRWLRENYAEDTVSKQHAGTTAAVKTVELPREAPSGQAAVAENGRVTESAGPADCPMPDADSAPTASRKMWDATLAPGFEERYNGGGQEHEAGYDAYLTGCCFAAVATLRLGVTVKQLMAMSTEGGTPEPLVPVSNVIPLYRTLGGRHMYLPGPAPPLDVSRYVHVSGFPSSARTDEVTRPLKTIEGCERIWFHWIDDLSGIAECSSADSARKLIEAASSAKAKPGVDEPAGKTTDAPRLLLEDMIVEQLTGSLLEADGMHDGLAQERSAKRARHETVGDVKTTTDAP